jgi:ribosomal 50S subunit-recycling heat shock protein
LKEAGRKEFPQPAFLEAVREVTQGQPTQVTTFPNLGRTGTTPAAVGVEPQTEQDVRQETNAPQEGRGQGEDAAPVPQEEGRQEGQVTPPDVAQEGETPPATKRTRKTEQQKADEGKAILDKLKETLRALKAKPGGGANIDLTFGVVPISKAVWNTAIDTAILAIDAGQSLAQAVKAASDYISSKIDGDWGKAKFGQYMEDLLTEARGMIRERVSYTPFPEGLALVDGWYSTIEKRIREAKQDKQSASAWLNSGLIGKGDEATYTGVRGWLEGKKPNEQVSKQDILNFMKDNRIQIVEVVKGAEQKQVKYKQLSDMPNAIYGYAERFIETGDKKFLSKIENEGYKVHYDNNGEVDYFTKEEKTYVVDNTKFSQYQLEGEKSNYKEVLITLPTLNELPQGWTIRLRSNVTPGTADRPFGVYDPDGKLIYTAKNETDGKAILRRYEKTEPKTFQSTHFDEPNILVHLRMNTRTDADGNKVLFLEEVQSDWGQKGKREGFANITELPKGYRIDEPTKFSDWTVVEPSGVDGNFQSTTIGQGKTKEEAIQRALDNLNRRKTPTAPFVTDTNAWTKLAVKTAMREAAKQGVDKIAWTTGEQQNERYDLSKQVDYITKNVDKINEDRSYVDISTTNGLITIIIDNRIEPGKILEVTNQGTSDMVGKNIEDVVGKDVATRIIDGKDGLRLEGEGLKLGGKGMKGFYDKIVPDAFKSVVKELTGQDAVISETTLNTPEKTIQQSIPLTTRLKGQIERGMPLFEGEKASVQQRAEKVRGDITKATEALTQAQPEAKVKKSSPKPLTVFHAGTLEGKGNIYVSPIREQANEYSSMSGAPVLEFEINENAMAPESEVRDLIRSLGLKLPEGYNLDELFLYEALDTRVKSSLSQGDIDKLYAALKDNGYEGIAFRDEDIRGVKREGIDNFIVFEKISLNQQQARPEAQVEATAKALEDALAPDDAFEMYRLSHVSDKGFVLQKSWIEEKLIELLPKIGARRFASLVREYVDEYFSASILKTPGMSFGELIGYLIGDGNLVYQGTETKWAELLKSQGVDVPSPKPGNVTYNPIRISEAYHKAKADGSNPKLVQAVDELLGQTPEAKPAKTIAEQRKEFRETAKKYFDGLKKMGIAFDPEGNSKEDIAFLKALAKYIKLELDNGMVTFKGFLEKTSNLIEGFNEKAVVSAAKEAWAKEVVKAYPKLYAKYSAAKRKELEREIKDIKKTMIRKIREMTDPKIVNFKSQLKTEKRRLSKEAAAQLAAINNAYDIKTMMAMEPQDLMELLNLTEGIYKEGRSEIKALNESLDEAAQIQGEEMLAAVTSKDKRLDKLSDKEAARRKLKFKSGVVVAVNNDERVILKEEAELDALTGEGYNFFFLNTTGDKVVNRGFLDSVASFFSGKLRTINENARDLRTALELIKSKSKESQDFINGLVAKMNKASVTKARKSEDWSSILKDERTKFFGPDIKFGYTNWMNAIAKVDGKVLELIDGRGEPIGPINNGKIVSLYRQLMDPTNLVKTDNVRKINLSDESIQSIIDYMNLPANKPGKGFALSLTKFFLQVAKDTKAVLENNGYNSTKLDEKRYNTEDFEGDEFIAQVMGQFADTRTEGFIPYTPIQATESPDTIQGVEINEDDLLNSGDLQKNFSVISNNMITRRPGGVIVPTDIRQTLNAYTAGMANMNAKLPLLRETQSVFSKRNLTAMSNAFAPQFTDNLKSNYISFMTDRVTPVSSSKTTAAIKTWLMTSTAIPMFLNLKSASLQILATPNFAVSYDFSKYIDASKKVFGDMGLLKETALEIFNLPTIKQRFGGRFSPDSRVIAEEMSRYGKVAINIPFTNVRISAKELLSKGYVFSSIGDVLTIAIGGAPIYYDITQTNKKKYMSEGMSALEAEKKAKQDAEEKLFEIIQETQQSSEAMYLSEFQKQSITRIFSSFATATQQYYRKARRAAARMKNKEGNQLQNAYEILHYTAINAALFQFFSSMFVEYLSGPGEDELEEASRQERIDWIRAMEDVMATVAQGTGALGVALQALILAYKESEKSGKPEKIVESALRTMPAVRMKYDAAVNTIREWKRGDYVRSLTKGAELANIPADRIRSLGLQVSDALMENLDAQERIARLMGFRTESWMREKKQGEIWNGVQSAVDKSTPAERQRAISNTKSAYRDLFQLYGKRYAEATTEAEKARVDSIASKELLNVYNHRQGGQELTEELQKLFNQSIEFNSLPKDLQKLKNMETNRKIGDVVEEVLSLEKKSEQKAMEYWSSLVNNGIISDKEIDRVREEYNTRKGLQ